MKRIRLITLLSLLVILVCGCSDKYIRSDILTSETVSIELTNQFDINTVPAYSGDPVVVINNNIPFFTKEDISDIEFETYSPLDALSRCGTAYANICKDIMPVDEREGIGYVKPSGWKQAKYDTSVTGMDSPYLYNRCHLIAFELAGENANEKNLITGTRYMNICGMLPYENKVATYVKKTDHHVLYRVTPLFEDDNLVASGVLIEAKSVEDDDCVFCVYCYNVEPGVEINYHDGSSNGPEFSGSDAGKTVFWTEGGSCYHYDRKCSAFKNSKNVIAGSMEDCPKEKACSMCCK